MIRHLHPNLPEEIDLTDWLQSVGVALDVCPVEGAPVLLQDSIGQVPCHLIATEI